MDWSSDSDDVSSSSIDTPRNYHKSFQSEFQQMQKKPHEVSSQDSFLEEEQVQSPGNTTISAPNSPRKPNGQRETMQAMKRPAPKGPPPHDVETGLVIADQDDEYVETCCAAGNLVRWFFGVLFLAWALNPMSQVINIGPAISLCIAGTFLKSATWVRDGRCCCFCKPCCCTPGKCGVDPTAEQIESGQADVTNRGKRGRSPRCHALFEIFAFTMLLIFNVLMEVKITNQGLMAPVNMGITMLGQTTQSYVSSVSFLDDIHNSTFNSGNCDRFDSSQTSRIDTTINDLGLAIFGPNEIYGRSTSSNDTFSIAVGLLDNALVHKNCSLDKLLLLLLIDVFLMITYCCACCSPKKKNINAVGPAE